jgi:hypothetical protein
MLPYQLKWLSVGLDSTDGARKLNQVSLFVRRGILSSVLVSYPPSSWFLY